MVDNIYGAPSQQVSVSCLFTAIKWCHCFSYPIVHNISSTLGDKLQTGLRWRLKPFQCLYTFKITTENPRNAQHELELMLQQFLDDTNSNEAEIKRCII